MCLGRRVPPCLHASTATQHLAARRCLANCGGQLPSPISLPLQEFNKGLFDYLIATDDVHGSAAAAGEGGGGKQQRRKGGGGGKDKGGKRKKDEEFGVTRGIDFKARWARCACCARLCLLWASQRLEYVCGCMQRRHSSLPTTSGRMPA